MPPDGRLVDTANFMMNELVARLTAEGIAVPERRYIHSGEFAADLAGTQCAEHLVIAWQGTVHGIPGAEASGAPMTCAVPLTGVYTIFLLRCVPVVTRTGNAPSAEELDASGTEIMYDGMTLPKVIIDAWEDGDLVPFGCALVGLGDIAPFGPQGGVGGHSVSLLVGLV